MEWIMVWNTHNILYMLVSKRLWQKRLSPNIDLDLHEHFIGNI